MRYMKGYFVLGILILSLSVHSLYGQVGIGKGIKIGNNFATLSDSKGETKTLNGLCGGVSLHLNMLGALSFEIDFLYSPRGVGVKGEKDIKLNYISIPITLKKRLLPFGIRPYVLGGIEFSYLLSAEGPVDDFKKLLNSQDLAVVAGLGAELSFIGKGVYAEGRYSFGFDKIFKEDIDVEYFKGTEKNRVAQLYIGIFF